MNKSEQIEQITAAIVACMAAIKGVEKNSTVGSGNYQYKGVSDKDVKNTVRAEMVKNGIAIIPMGMKESLTVENYVDQNNKPKMQVFQKVVTSYLITHTSGQWIMAEDAGLGHGVDSADKAGGKATTYALKYFLLYLFQIPTGEIDDTDNHHSEELPKPPAPKPVPQTSFKDIVAVIQQATSENDLNVIYRANKSMQKDPAFIEALKSRKEQIKQS